MTVRKKPLGLPASYRIKRKKIFDRLASEGRSLFVYPFKLIYSSGELPEEVPFQVAFGVSKKKFRKAVRRNRIKRLMRESFRLNQHLLNKEKPLALLLIYTSNNEEKFDFLTERMQKLLNKLNETLNENHGKPQ